METSPKRPVGRPSPYRPEYCERVIELGKEGKLLVEIACALEVTRKTLAYWADEFQEFSAALARAREEAQMWWIGQGRSGLVLPKSVTFAQSVWMRVMACGWPDDWVEKQRVEHSGELNHKEKPADLSRLTDDELESYIALQEKIEGKADA